MRSLRHSPVWRTSEATWCGFNLRAEPIPLVRRLLLFNEKLITEGHWGPELLHLTEDCSFVFQHLSESPHRQWSESNKIIQKCLNYREKNGKFWLLLVLSQQGTHCSDHSPAPIRNKKYTYIYTHFPHCDFSCLVFSFYLHKNKSNEVQLCTASNRVFIYILQLGIMGSGTAWFCTFTL